MHRSRLRSNRLVTLIFPVTTDATSHSGMSPGHSLFLCDLATILLAFLCINHVRHQNHDYMLFLSSLASASNMFPIHHKRLFKPGRRRRKKGKPRNGNVCLPLSIPSCQKAGATDSAGLYVTCYSRKSFLAYKKSTQSRASFVNDPSVNFSCCKKLFRKLLLLL